MQVHVFENECLCLHFWLGTSYFFYCGDYPVLPAYLKWAVDYRLYTSPLVIISLVTYWHYMVAAFVLHKIVQ